MANVDSTKTTKSIDWVTFCWSCVVRLLFWPAAIYVFYYCVQLGYSLTVLHVVFFTIGCGLLMVEATLLVTGDALLASRVVKSTRVKIHAILHGLALVAIVVGLVTIMIEEGANPEGHFSSKHGKVGLAGIILGFFVNITALPTLYREIIPKAINFGRYKRIHIYLGIIATTLLWVAQVSGFYRPWWTASTLASHLTAAAYVLGLFFLLIKPLCLTLWRSYKALCG